MLSEKELDTLLFAQVTDKLANVFSVDTRNQRIDSVHISSNMRRLGRIGIFVRVITRFLLNLRRHHRDMFESLDVSYARRYLTREGQGAFSMVRPSESDRTLEKVASDLFDLVHRFAGCGNVTGMSSYKHMSRVLSEQCTLDSAWEDDGTGGRKTGERDSFGLAAKPLRPGGRVQQPQRARVSGADHGDLLPFGRIQRGEGPSVDHLRSGGASP
jgi:hypothetical protein